MSLKMVDPEAQAQEREKFAQYLEQFAASIRQTEAVPVGLILHIFMGHGAVLRRKRIGENFNLLEAMGVLDYSKAELLAMVGKNEHPVVPPQGPTG